MFLEGVLLLRAESLRGLGVVEGSWKWRERCCYV